MITAKIIFHILSIVTSVIGIVVCVVIYTHTNSLSYSFDNGILRSRIDRYNNTKSDDEPRETFYFKCGRHDDVKTDLMPFDKIPVCNFAKYEYDRELSGFLSSMIIALYLDRTTDIDNLELRFIRRINPFNTNLNKDIKFPFGGIWRDSSNNLVMCFTGTHTYDHWMHNARLNQTAYDKYNMSVTYPTFMREDKRIMIHDGFLTLYSEIIKVIEAILTDFPVSTTNIYITGHSLGGAIATILHKELMHRGYTSCCYAFGCPRVGNHRFASGIKNITRIINTEDIIPFMPCIIPNFSNETDPYMYTHTENVFSFTKNLYSFYNNHSIYLYHLYDNHIIKLL